MYTNTTNTQNNLNSLVTNTTNTQNNLNSLTSNVTNLTNVIDLGATGSNSFRLNLTNGKDFNVTLSSGSGGANLVTLNSTNGTDAHNITLTWDNGTTFTTTINDQSGGTPFDGNISIINVSERAIINISEVNNYVVPNAFQTQFMKCYESELGGTAAAPNNALNSPYYVQTISSGAVVGTTSGADNHPLITTLRDSTTANGGALIGMSLVNAGQFIPQAGDELRAIVRFKDGKAATVTTRIGFMDN